MAFVKGKPRPPNAGGKKGSRNKATERIRKLLEDNASEVGKLKEAMTPAARTEL